MAPDSMKNLGYQDLDKSTSEAEKQGENTKSAKDS